MRRAITVRQLTALILTLGLAPIAETATVHFVVAESGAAVHGDSYILPLENPDHIAHARSLIDGGPGVGSSIIVATIAKGVDGINRDFFATGEPLWSWHIAEFQGFTDITAEILDGWPSFVEQDVDGWIANTGGYIGFWNYTVVAEISAVPVPSAFALFASALGAFVIRRPSSAYRRTARAAWRAKRRRLQTAPESGVVPLGP